MEMLCLEFKKLDKLYPINCEQALSIGFLKVEGTEPTDQYSTAENVTNSRDTKYSVRFESSSSEV
jgi:hypothetical protein